MLFRSNDLLNDFERMTKGLNFGPDFEKAVEDISTAFSGAFTGEQNATVDVARRAFAGGSNVDIVRSAQNYTIYADLPGVDPDAVDLTIEGRKLTISATREFTINDTDEHVQAGRRHGSFTRTFKLTEDLDIDGLSARSEHGVLIVTIPVVPKAEPRKITISS